MWVQLTAQDPGHRLGDFAHARPLCLQAAGGLFPQHRHLTSAAPGKARALDMAVVWDGPSSEQTGPERSIDAWRRSSILRVRFGRSWFFLLRPLDS